MPFQTGTVSNSHELVNKIHGFMANFGWYRVSTISHSNCDEDHVFYSSGSDGKHDIYIRISAGQSDKTTVGDIQFPYEDGYTGYVNGFAYQYFPENGSESDGLNMIGKYGPILYLPQCDDSDDDPGDIDEYNFWTFTGLNTAELRYRNVYDGVSGFGAWIPSSIPSGFDGKRYLYQNSYLGEIRKLDLFDETVTDTTLADLASSRFSANGSYVKTRGGKEYMYFIKVQTPGTSANQYLARFDIQSNTVDTGFSNDMPFTMPNTVNSRPYYGFVCVGTKRKKQGTFGPQHRLLYVAIGNKYDDASIGSDEWAYVDAETGKWGNLISPSLPWTIGQSSGTDIRSTGVVYVPKETSGYSYDRIYIGRGGGNTEFVSIEVDDDGYISGSWTSHADLPKDYSVHLFASDSCIYYMTGFAFGNSDSYTRLYKWEFPSSATDSGNWELVSSDAWNNKISAGAVGLVSDMHQHLSNRVSVSENDTNTYWLFGNKDRLVVVVKNAEGEYGYIYLGAFLPYASPHVARLTQAVSSGVRTINVNTPSLFEIGRYYMISDTQGGYITDTSLGGETRKFAPSEIIRVVNKSGSNLVLQNTLSYSYSQSSLVGEDPVPVACRVHSLDYAQTFDVINKVDDNNFKDPPWQRYFLSASSAISVTNERTDEKFLYSFLLKGENDTYTGREVRGQLIDIYSPTATVTSEEEISVGSSTYLAFNIDNAGNSKIVVGPK